MVDSLREDDQESCLRDARNNVKQQSFLMHAAKDKNDLNECLKHCAEMLRELRTSVLSPKNYYDLYIHILDELRGLDTYFEDVNRKGMPMNKLYEKVQSCGNVLPRLYLLITVGSVYIKSKEAPAKEILKDLVEMTKGVQHPMRGLFLRNYLSNMSKDKLPDVGSGYEGVGGTVDDALDFVLQNFAETNRLWIRMQHQNTIRDKKQREKERQELRILVGTNLVRLSQLEGVTLKMYSENVLPNILKQVVSCKDKIAQQYLMDCIIQVFPDEFHINNLEPFLKTCTELQPLVDVKTIMVTLMNRLAKYSEGNIEAIPPDVPAFQIFKEYVAKVAEEKSNEVSPADLLALQIGLLNFAMQCYPQNMAYVDHILNYSAKLLAQVSSVPVTEVELLLKIPLDSFSLEVFNLDSYPELIAHLPNRNRRMVSVKILRTVLDSKSFLTDVSIVDKLLNLISPLIKDDAETVLENEETKEDFRQEQLLVAKVVHLLKNENPDILFQIYCTARRHFGQGGVKRIQYTLIPLVFGALNLTHELNAKEMQGQLYNATPRKLLQFVHEIVTALASNFPQVSLRLFLQCAETANRCHFEAISYEFITQAFILYEDEMSDSKAQLQSLYMMIGTLLCCRNLSEDNYDTLITRTTQYSAKLLKKTDQCRLVTMCSHLFWADSMNGKDREFHDGRRVLECLQRCLKIADVCVTSSSTNVDLFVEILDHYLYYYERKNPSIRAKYISGLLALIKEHLDNIEQGPARSTVESHYRNVLKHIERKGYDLNRKEEGPEVLESKASRGNSMDCEKQ